MQLHKIKKLEKKEDDDERRKKISPQSQNAECNQSEHMRFNCPVFKRRMKNLTRNFKEKKENKGYIIWKDNVINSSSDSENKIVSLNIMIKDYENGEKQSRYIDNNFSKHMTCIKVYSYFSLS